jgi:DHA2 family multidrug resistance protein-like MFS transporter
MATILIGILISGLDSSIANVALPTISHELQVSPAATVWVVNAFQLAAAICILPFSNISERVGYRRVYLLGLSFFTISSLGCATAQNLTWLIVARACQGASAAAINGVSQALVRMIYPRRILGSGMSWYTLMVAIAASIGPILGSAILSVADWPWLFTINLPIGALAVFIGLRSLPESPRRLAVFDPTGTLLNAFFFALFILGVGGLGRSDAAFLSSVEIIGALACGVLLWRHQVQKPSPMLPVDLFRIPVFALSSLTSICSYAAQTMALVAIPFYVQDFLGRSQNELGLIITPWPLAVMVVSRIAGYASDRYPIGLLASLGLGVMAAGLALLVFLPPDPSMLDIIWRVALCGLGFGFFQTPNNRAMMTAGPRDRSGAANGAMGASRTLGQTSGAAAAAAAFALFPAYGPKAVFLLAVMLAVAGSIVSALRLSREK